jgi:YbbR domain-containing protein
MIVLLRDLIFKDFWLKLFSFGLAVMLWFTVNIAVRDAATPGNAFKVRPVGQRVFSNVPVVILCSAENAGRFTIVPKEVKITVQGEMRFLNDLQGKDIRVMVDLTGIESANDLRKRLEVSVPTTVARFWVEPEEVQVISPP